MLKYSFGTLPHLFFPQDVFTHFVYKFHERECSSHLYSFRQIEYAIYFCTSLPYCNMHFKHFYLFSYIHLVTKGHHVTSKR